MSPVGEALRRARQERGITVEDAERVTRIPRKYLIALEQGEYGLLPAPVYARGFLRSYASYLGLDPRELMPFFPVGHVEEPKLEPLPEVKATRTYSTNALVAVAAVGLLILAVVALYGFGREGGGDSLVRSQPTLQEEASPGSQAPAQAGEGLVLPDFRGQAMADAIAALQAQGIDYVVVAVRQGDVPKGQVVGQEPPPGKAVEPGQTVTLIVSR